MKRSIIVFLALLSQTLLPGVVPSAQSPDEPLRVEIKVNTETSRSGNIDVDFSVRNVSDRKQEFAVMSCSYEDNWTTDSSVVTVLAVHECDKNFPAPKSLEPGETYTGELTLQFQESKESRGHAFRLGFRPYRRAFSRDVSHVYWSKQLKVGG